jgi:hypothetical protein
LIEDYFGEADLELEDFIIALMRKETSPRSIVAEISDLFADDSVEFVELLLEEAVSQATS